MTTSNHNERPTMQASPPKEMSSRTDSEPDETEYLMGTSANAARLRRALKNVEAGRVAEVKRDFFK